MRKKEKIYRYRWETYRYRLQNHSRGHVQSFELVLLLLLLSLSTPFLSLSSLLLCSKQWAAWWRRRETATNWSACRFYKAWFSAATPIGAAELATSCRSSPPSLDVCCSFSPPWRFCPRRTTVGVAALSSPRSAHIPIFRFCVLFFSILCLILSCSVLFCSVKFNYGKEVRHLNVDRESVFRVPVSVKSCLFI